jgi:hypothetical protein
LSDWAGDLRRNRRIKYRYVGFGLLILIAVGVVRSGRTVPLTKSCTTAAFALDTYSPRNGSVDKLSITGPDGEYVLGVDLVSAKVTTTGLLQARLADGSLATAKQLIGDAVKVKGCLAHSAGLVQVPEGTHTVALYRIVGTTATKLAEHSLDVQPHR